MDKTSRSPKANNTHKFEKNRKEKSIMKNTNKILAAVLAVVMVFALAVPAFAANEGSITITNAQIGKTYTIYKAFDATYSTYTEGGQTKTAVSYSTKNAALIAAIEADKAKEAPTDASKAGTVCPFTFDGEADATGRITIVHKEGFPTAMGKGWLKNNTALLTEFSDSKTCESGTSVAFTGIPTGYYVILPGDGATATVTTAAPTVEVIDKNPSAPSGFAKSTAAESKGVAIGDTLDYEMSLTATNFYTESGSSTSKAIYKYEIADIAIGLENLTVSSVRYYKAGEDVTDATKGTAIPAYNADSAKNGYKVVKTTTTVAGANSTTVTKTTNTFEIPWATVSDNVYTSLYPAPVTVVIRYKMTVNEDATKTANLTADNEMSVKISYDGGTKEFPPSQDTPDQKSSVHTTSLSIRKVDAADDSVALSNAKFVLYKIVPIEGATQEPLTKKVYYKWDTTNKKGIWVDTLANATEMTADNQYGTQEFKGIGEGTFYLHETLPPAGYNPGEDITVVISYDEGFTVTIDGAETDPNSYNYYTVVVANSKGSAMPATGGTGTVLLVSVGVVLFLAAGIVLVTKKRMYNEG